MEENNQVQENDITVLEALKGWLKGQPMRLPDQGDVPESQKPGLTSIAATPKAFFGGLLFILIAQFGLEYFRNGPLFLVILMFLGGFGLLIYSKKRGEMERLHFWRQKDPDEKQINRGEPTFRWVWLLASLVTAVLALWIYKDGFHNLLSIVLWLLSAGFALASFWQSSSKKFSVQVKEEIEAFKTHKEALAFGLVVLVLVSVFQFFKIAEIPKEMVSTQVESFLSVHAIQNGELALWFPRNLVSEPVSYYWAALVSRIFGTPLSFTGLKVTFALTGLLGVFFTYMLAKLLFDRQTGWIAALLVGVGFAPILQQRALTGYGLVIPLLAAILFTLFKSLEENDINALLMSSLLTSIGIMTNKLILVMPLVGLIISILYFHLNNGENRQNKLLMRIAISVIVSLITLLPLLLVVFSNFEVWIAPLANGLAWTGAFQNRLLIFMSNFISSAGVVNWSNRSTWVDGIPMRAGLDWVSAALAAFGVMLMLVRSGKTDRAKVYSFGVFCFVFLIYSAINFAFPSENPSLAKGLPILLFALLLAARAIRLAFDLFPNFQGKAIKAWQYGIGALLLLISITANYNLVNSVYADRFTESAWNASEMAAVLNNYEKGSPGLSTGYVVGYPHWVDARAVAILGGRPDENLSILPADLATTVTEPDPKIFLLNPLDKEGLSALQSIYPQGVVTTYQSVNAGKNFLIYIVGQ